MICAFGLLLGCENIVSVQCFVNQFGFRASRKGTEQVESVVCAFADGNADPDSFFFLLVHNGIFFCAFGLLFEMNVVPLCRLEQVCYSHTTACSVFMLGAFRSQFFCAYGEMSVIVPKEINQFFFLNLIQYNVFNVSFYLFDSSTHYLRSYDIDKYVLAIVFMVFHVV